MSFSMRLKHPPVHPDLLSTVLTPYLPPFQPLAVVLCKSSLSSTLKPIHTAIAASSINQSPALQDRPGLVLVLNRNLPPSTRLTSSRFKVTGFVVDRILVLTALIRRSFHSALTSLLHWFSGRGPELGLRRSPALYFQTYQLPQY